jgi:shikimate dehydrogenase
MIKAAVVGWPVDHSRSPIIHRTWLEQYGIAGAYDRIAVEPGQMPAFVASLAERGLKGCNVTIPHKLAAFEAADEPEESARAVGAANLVWRDGTKVRAANTDGEGFMAHLADTAPHWKAGRCQALILGAGGAARSIVYGFMVAGIEQITLVNRTEATAIELARVLAELAARYRTRITVKPWFDRNAALGASSVVVNTTSLGMKGAGSLGLDFSRANTSAVVADIVYVPLETGLLADARAAGLTVVDGLGMLLHQAVPAFECFWGRRPTVTPELRARLVADLGG